MAAKNPIQNKVLFQDGYATPGFQVLFLTKTKKGPTTAFFLSIKNQQQLPILITWFHGTKILNSSFAC